MCGVVGLIGTPDAAKEVFLGLTTLQHRGQDGAGILTFDHLGFHQVKNLGLVESVFTKENMSTLTGTVAIGHTRYSTIGRSELAEVQPFLLNYPFGLGMVHNGNLVNCAQLAESLISQSRRRLLTHSDTEVILNLFAQGLADYPAINEDSKDQVFGRICNSIENIFKLINGSYSVATLIADQGLVAFRDPLGMRPLILGSKKLESGKIAHIVASESVALSFLGYDVVRDVQPGEILWVDMDGNVYSRLLAPAQIPPTRHCMFEWVYFASPESVIDQNPVYSARIQLGKTLGQLVKKQIDERKIQPDLIVPVPETSRIAAIALAEVVGLPYREVLIKNRYIKRTFILDSQEKRQNAVSLKLSPVRSEIEGKRVLLVDDSIVRGTTSKKIIELVRKAGAKAVYFVSTCPPIKHPCYYGIDFPMESELIASGQPNRVEELLGADAVIYQDIPGLEQALRIPGQEPNLCMACLGGGYPTDITAGIQQSAAREIAGKKGEK